MINLRYLNRFLWKNRFKYEDLSVAMLLLERNDSMFSFDLKSGYHHVDIAQEHWKYLGFRWGGHYYCFTLLLLYFHQFGAPPGGVLEGERPANYCVSGRWPLRCGRGDQSPGG